MRSRVHGLASWGLAAAALGGCASFDGDILASLDSEQVPDAPVTRTVGTKGGTVSAGPFSATFPEGALEQSQEITLSVRAEVDGKRLPDGLRGELRSQVLVATPHGQKFEKDVVLRLPLDADTPEGANLAVYRLDDDEDRTWEAADGASVNLGQARASVKTRSFSYYAVFEIGKDGGDAGLDAGEPDDAGGVDAGDAGVDAEVDAGPTGPVLVANLCDPDTSILPSANLAVDLSSEGMDNQKDVACAEGSSPGGEGWFAVQAVAGQRWHFHVIPRNPADAAVQNPFVYATDNCDFRSACVPASTQNICGDDKDEHFTFQATSTGLWYVALDDANPDVNGDFRVLAINTICGDGQKEHNEACDDGNLLAGDGCSEACRVEFKGDDGLEAEPNDDWTTANLMLDVDAVGTSQQIRGTIGGLCDVDVFAVHVPEGASLRASLAPNDGSACDDVDRSGASLTLIGTNGQTELGLGINPPAPTICSRIDHNTDDFAAALPEGIYFLRVFGQEDKDALNYRLDVTLD